MPEVRDYQRINADLVNLLDHGCREVHLEGAEGQRLLVSGLVGPWRATVRVKGRAGPELAANLDAPGLIVVVDGPVGDGAASGLKAGCVIIRGVAGDALGYAQVGGMIQALGPVGHRAGLRQSGGCLVISGGSAGRLTGERQAGGLIVVVDSHLGPHAGRGRAGGGLIEHQVGPREGNPGDGRATGSVIG